MINVVVLAGNVVADPESRSTNSGKSIATFRLAINNTSNDKDTVFIDVDTWEKQADFVSQYVKKGSSVSVTGRLKQDSWEKDGKKFSKILVVAERVNFVGGKKKEGTEDASQEVSSTSVKKAVAAPAKSGYTPKYVAKSAAPAAQGDEDIPI
jgi:single-strand DNA-binding protein